ncbi:MAG: N-acetylglucosamine-6-phosphate deacetylase [Lachnospiraceae bacterium]|nr:N-acetylglucosamine-6-phosphate deacetylase [Candidatus Darwinimomas equi]
MKAIINGKIVLPERIIEGTVLTDGEMITAVGDISVPDGAEVIDAGGLYVGPGLIDQHVHGYHQFDEGFDIIDNTRAVADAHLRHGVTSITPSPSYSLRMERYLEIIRQCNEAIEEGHNSIVGIHLEGPYINPRMGAGRKYAWKYSDEAFTRLFEESRGNVRHCTYAPEMPFAENVEDIINRYGAVMDIGHTMADPESIYRSVRKGLKIVTHLFDATGNWQGIHASDMTGDPQDGVSYVTLGIPDLYYEIISDSRGIHVTAPSQRLALKCAGEDHIILVSDCTYHKRADQNPEEYPDSDLRSAQDINVSREGRLFGSRLTVADCAANFMKATGADIRVVFKCAASNSACALGLDDRIGSIAPGKKANLVFADEAFKIKTVIFEGERIPEVRSR